MPDIVKLESLEEQKFKCTVFSYNYDLYQFNLDTQRVNNIVASVSSEIKPLELLPKFYFELVSGEITTNDLKNLMRYHKKRSEIFKERDIRSKKYDQDIATNVVRTAHTDAKKTMDEWEKKNPETGKLITKGTSGNPDVRETRNDGYTYGVGCEYVGPYLYDPIHTDKKNTLNELAGRKSIYTNDSDEYDV